MEQGQLLPDEPRVYSVSELVSEVRDLVERALGRLWVVGEVSNLHAARSGHSYFTLKDSGGQLRAALFRREARGVPFELEDGLEVLVWGELSVYPARGDLQLLVRRLEPRGQGALQLAFEQLRRRLEGEGLFDAALKRPLPGFPRRVGIVTSPTGAAIRDVIEVSGQCFPGTPLLVSPTRVQGEGADREIVGALEALALRGGCDVILLVRGGGSLEDLMAFNSEVLARAIRACPIPVVTGVGHETDVSIADLAADARAPTPSAAAALVLPERAALAARIDRDQRRLGAAVAAILERAAGIHGRLHLGLRAGSPVVRLASQRRRLEVAMRGLGRGVEGVRSARSHHLSSLAARLDALSPLAVLGRGYAIVKRADSAAIVRRADEVARGDDLRIRVSEGEIEASVKGTRDLPE